MNLEGARLARAASPTGTARFVAGSVGPLERDALALAEASRTRPTARSRSTTSSDAYAEQMRGARATAASTCS